MKIRRFRQILSTIRKQYKMFHGLEVVLNSPFSCYLVCRLLIFFAKIAKKNIYTPMHLCTVTKHFQGDKIMRGEMNCV